MENLLHDEERDYLQEKGREHEQERVARKWADFLNYYVVASVMLLLYTMLLLLLVPWLRPEKISLGTDGIYCEPPRPVSQVSLVALLTHLKLSACQ